MARLYAALIYPVPLVILICGFLFFLFLVLQKRWRRHVAPRENSGLQPKPSEVGLKKEIREMLPVIIFRESFLIKEPMCSVCLEDYQCNDRLQQIPSCGHAFHVDCIDLWLTSNVTCPLCRISLLSAANSDESPEQIAEDGDLVQEAGADCGDALHESRRDQQQEIIMVVSSIPVLDP